MNRPKPTPPKPAFYGARYQASLRLWIVAPLLAVFLVLVVALLISYFTTGYFQPEWLIIAIIVLVVFVGPGLFATQRVIRRIEQMIQAAEQVAQGNLHVKIDDESQDEIGQLIRAFNDMVKNLGHVQESRDLLSRTMSPAVRQSLIEKGLDFRGITQVVSVLFIDIRNFTRITESHHSTEQLVFFLNDYYTTIANQVHVGGGIIGKYAGDSILAYFGAPTPEPSTKSSSAALLTALALQDAIEELSERWSFLGLPPIRVGIGLSIGPVVAGPVGSEQQFEYTVIGDAVNLASRLQDFTKNISGFNIILSAEAYQALEDRIKDQIQVLSYQVYEQLDQREKARRSVVFVDLGEILVKGKKEPVHVYGIPDFDAHHTNGRVKVSEVQSSLGP
jgi:adenylate cyclase